MRAILQQPLRSFWPSLCLLAFAVVPACAQGPASQPPAEGQAELGANIEANIEMKIDALTHSIEQMQSQLQQSQAEIQQLREMLGEVLRAQGAQGSRAQRVLQLPPAATASHPPPIRKLPPRAGLLRRSAKTIGRS